MQYLDTRIYERGETYKGAGVLEQSHFEFLKSYGKDDAKNIIFDSVLQAAIDNGCEALKTIIYYAETTLYHTFNVDYYYIRPEQMSGLSGSENIVIRNNGVRIGHNGVEVIGGTVKGTVGDIQSLIFPWAPLIYAIAVIIVAILGYLLASSFLLNINSVQYTPSGASWSPLMYIGVMFVGVMLLNTLTKTSKEVRKW